MSGIGDLCIVLTNMLEERDDLRDEDDYYAGMTLARVLVDKVASARPRPSEPAHPEVNLLESWYAMPAVDESPPAAGAP